MVAPGDTVAARGIGRKQLRPPGREKNLLSDRDLRPAGGKSHIRPAWRVLYITTLSQKKGKEQPPNKKEKGQGRGRNENILNEKQTEARLATREFLTPNPGPYALP